MPPLRLFHREPVAEGLQAELQQPVGLTLLLRDESHHVLAESHGNHLRRHVGGEAELILLFGYAAHQLVVALVLALATYILILQIFFHDDCSRTNVVQRYE